MKPYSTSELKYLADEFADILRQSKCPFLIIYFPNEESEPISIREGEIQSQIALLDSLNADIHDEAINSFDESMRLMDAAQKKIELYERRRN